MEMWRNVRASKQKETPGRGGRRTGNGYFFATADRGMAGRYGSLTGIGFVGHARFEPGIFPETEARPCSGAGGDDMVGEVNPFFLS